MIPEVYPARLPDLFVSRPVIVTGTFDGIADSPRGRGNATGASLASCTTTFTSARLAERLVRDLAVACRRFGRRRQRPIARSIRLRSSGCSTYASISARARSGALSARRLNAGIAASKAPSRAAPELNPLNMRRSIEP